MYKLEPELDLFALYIIRLTDIENDYVYTARITYEIVVCDVVWFIAGEFPHAQLSSSWTPHS